MRFTLILHACYQRQTCRRRYTLFFPYIYMCVIQTWHHILERRDSRPGFFDGSISPRNVFLHQLLDVGLRGHPPCYSLSLPKPGIPLSLISWRADWAVAQIHVDRYKHSIYSHIADPFLHSLITLDPSKARFHACERFNRCSHASSEDVVYINPVTIGKVKWEQYCLLTESKLRSAQPVRVLVRFCPFIAR